MTSLEKNSKISFQLLYQALKSNLKGFQQDHFNVGYLGTRYLNEIILKCFQLLKNYMTGFMSSLKNI